MPQQEQPTISHFDAAKAIVEAVKSLDKPMQALAMRFASETLGLPASPTTPPLGSPQGSAVPPQLDKHGVTHSADIKQFVTSRAPKSDNQFAAVVAYFYRFEAPDAQRTETIDATILQEATRLTGRSRLSNPGKTLHNAKNAGYLDAAGPGRFRVNSVGENLVAITLPGNGQEGPAQRTSRKKKSTKGKSASKISASRRG